MKKTMLAAAACLPTLLTAAEGGRPNFIVILADDMGTGDIGAYRELYPGGPEEPRFAARRDPNYPGTLPIQLAHQFTPNLDRLAREGIRCTRGYATAWCAPSRQMLFSGLWANRTNAYDHPWVGAQLRAAGYATGMMGKNHGVRPINRTYGNLDPDTAVALRPYPAEQVVEHPPVAGQVPVEGDGRALFDEMEELVRSAGRALVPSWSGAPDKQLEQFSQWWFEAGDYE